MSRTCPSSENHPAIDSEVILRADDQVGRWRALLMMVVTCAIVFVQRDVASGQDPQFWTSDAISPRSQSHSVWADVFAASVPDQESISGNAFAGPAIGHSGIAADSFEHLARGYARGGGPSFATRQAVMAPVPYGYASPAGFQGPISPNPYQRGMPYDQQDSPTTDAGNTAVNPSLSDEAIEVSGIGPRFASGGGTLSSADNSTIGDFFSGGMQMISSTSGLNTFASLPLAGGDRRFKIVENNNAFPTDRFFFNYNMFVNSVTDATNSTLNLDRYTFGMERIIDGNGWFSLEVRVPIALGLNSQQVTNPTGMSNNDDIEFGNIAVALKGLAIERGTWGVGAGLGVIFPTAADAVLYMGSLDDPRLIIANEAWHLQPFLGVRVTPNDRLWGQFFTQLDIDPSGNDVSFRTGSTGDFDRKGKLRDQNLLFVDLSFGYWFHRDNFDTRFIAGLAAILELHYSTTIQDTDAVFLTDPESMNEVVTNPYGRMDILNLTSGFRAQLGRNSYLTAAAVVPLRTQKFNADLKRYEEKQFDVEVAIQLSHTY